MRKYSEDTKEVSGKFIVRLSLMDKHEVSRDSYEIKRFVVDLSGASCSCIY